MACSIRHRALGTTVECLQGLSLWAGVCMLLFKGLRDPLLASRPLLLASRPIPEKQMTLSIEKQKKETKKCVPAGTGKSTANHNNRQKSVSGCMLVASRNGVSEKYVSRTVQRGSDVRSLQ